MDSEDKVLNMNTPEEEITTSRSIERLQEDQEYVSVIVKRNDEAVRHPDDILEKAIEEGVEQHQRSSASLFLSALAAGLILGFAGMCVALVHSIIPDGLGFPLIRVAVALVYPLGFIICIMSGTQLFTEQTATAVYPVLDKRSKIKSLIMLWILVLAGNLVGTFISSVLIYQSETVIATSSGFMEVFDHLISFSSGEVFMSAILAGWLMAQGGWLVMATPPASSQIICIYIVTFVIGLGGLHHSIAGSAEIFSGLLHTGAAEYRDAFRFLVMAIIGNLIGGSFFVGVLNYGHIRKAQ